MSGPVATAPTMHIGIAGPIASEDVAHLLDGGGASLPRGYPGAPFLATLIAELLARGHSVSAFTLSSDLPLNDDATVVARGPRFTLHVVPMRPRAWPLNGRRVGRIVDLYGFERRGLERAMQGAAPDVIHAHWAYEFAWAALASGLPHVVTCHDSPTLIARRSTGATRRSYRWLRAAMARHVLRGAKRVTAVSPYTREQIRGWCRVPVAVVANPIDPRAFALWRTAQPGRSRVCMVCNGWSDFKNPQVALLAFDLLSRQRHDTELVVCGDDFEPGGVAEAWWRTKRLAGRIDFRGRLGHSAVLALMAESDVLLHVSLEESFGAVVAEALALGLPVVAGASSGAVPWLVGDTGRLVDVTRPQEVAIALASALDQFDDTKASVGRGRERVRTLFSAPVVAAGYEAQYAAAMEGEREGAPP